MARTKNNNIRSIWASTIVIVILLIIAHYIGVLRPAEQVVLRATTPIQSRLYSLYTRDSTSESDSTASLTKEELVTTNNQLEEDINQLRTELAIAQQQLEDAQLLEEQRIFLEEYRLRGVSVSIVNRSTDYFSQIVTVDAGRADSIHAGDAVIIGNGILTGEVTQVDQYTSQVRLITSFDSQIAATIQNENSSPGIISGDHNIGLRMNFIPEHHIVDIDSTVTTSGLNNRIPTGLLIGTITEVQKEAGGVFQEARLEPFFDPNALQVMTVITQ